MPETDLRICPATTFYGPGVIIMMQLTEKITYHYHFFIHVKIWHVVSIIRYINMLHTRFYVT